MDENNLKDLVIAHDKSIDKMTMAIDHLTETVNTTVSTTNRKLEDIIDVIGKQHLLMEKFSNLETNLKDSFKRVYIRLEALEGTHTGQGCSAMKLANKTDEDISKRLTSLESSLTWIVRLIIGGLVSGALGTLAILVKGVH